MKKLVETLKFNNLTLGSAESITGGLFSSSVVSVSGASDVFLGAIVSYANSVKENVLKIDSKLIKDFGVVSEEIARAMAQGVSQVLNVDVSISFTGNAGPNVLEDKPVGCIWTCIKIKDDYYTFNDVLSGSRDEIREAIVLMSKERLIDLINLKGV